MHAVVTNVTVHDVERAQAMLREEVVPRASQASGFVNGYWTRKDNRGTSIILFDSEEAAQAVADRLQSEGFPEDAAVSLDNVEVREVVAQA